MDDFKNIDDIKAEEKRLYEEYKAKVAELKKIQKEKEAVGQVFTKGLLPIYVLFILHLGPSNGNDISNKISKRTSNLWTPSTGGIYPLLKKLEKDGKELPLLCKRFRENVDESTIDENLLKEYNALNSVPDEFLYIVMEMYKYVAEDN